MIQHLHFFIHSWLNIFTAGHLERSREMLSSVILITGLGALSKTGIYSLLCADIFDKIHCATKTN